MSAETVMVLPVLVAVALALAWAVSLGVHQVRVIDAAREVARGLARDDSAEQARSVGARVAPSGARISDRVEGGRVVVEVVAQVRGPSVLGLRLPSVTLRSEAVSLRESELGAGR